jgi:hypothetical protein
MTMIELFEDAASAETDERLLGLYPTNRYNLLEILSSGMVSPLAAYDKYYHDLLERSPGRIPLFAQSISEDVMAVCTSEGTATFPVIVELHSSAVHDDRFPTIDKKGRGGKAVLGDERGTAWVVSGPFAIDEQCVIHFKSKEDLEEHRLQEYENIRHDDWTYRVSPLMFGGQGNTDVLTWLSRLAPVNVPTPDDFRVVDKEGGAIALLSSGDDETSRAIGRYLLGDRTATDIPDHLSYLVEGVRHNVDRESRLFYAVVSTLRSFDPRTFAPTAFLEALFKTEELHHLRRSDHVFITRGIDQLRKVLANEVEFVAFPAKSGSAVMRALMLLVLRPDPKRLAEWSPEEINAKGLTFALARLFVGYLYGRKRMPVWYRPKDVDRQIAMRTAQRLRDLQATRGKRGKVATSKRIAELLTRYNDASNEDQRAAAGRALAKACGWDDCLRDEYVVREEDVESLERGLVRVRIRQGIGKETVFSMEDLQEHIRLRFGSDATQRD